MILNQTQAKAVFDALCALNNVSLRSAVFDIPGGTRIHLAHDGALLIFGKDQDDNPYKIVSREVYDDQAAFIAAYNLS